MGMIEIILYIVELFKILITAVVGNPLLLTMALVTIAAGTLSFALRRR